MPPDGRQGHICTPELISQKEEPEPWRGPEPQNRISTVKEEEKCISPNFPNFKPWNKEVELGWEVGQKVRP